MNKKILLYILIASCSLVFALVTRHNMVSSDRNYVYAERIENGLHKHQQSVADILEDKDFLKRRLSANSKIANKEDDQDLVKLDAISAEPFSIIFEKQGIIEFWTSTSTPFDNVDLAQIPKNGEMISLQLSNGQYLGKRETISDAFFDEYSIYSFFPIKREYHIESEYLNKQFATEKYVPNAVQLTTKTTSYPIKDNAGKVVSYLNHDTQSIDIYSLKKCAITFGLFLLFFGLIINYISKMLAQKYTLGVGAGFLLTSILTYKLLDYNFSFTNEFSSLSLFNRDFLNFYVSESLGDLLIDILILLWIILFFHRNIGNYHFDRVSSVSKQVLGFMNSAVIAMSIINVANVIRGLILDSNIEFDFSYMLNIQNESLLAIVGVVLLTLGLFLFSHLLMLINHRLEIPDFNRQVMYFASTALAVPLLYAVNLELDTVRFLLFILAYQILFDIFVFGKYNNLSWLIFWIVVMAIFSSSLIFNFSEDKDMMQRKQYAKILSENRDQFIEKDLAVFSQFVNNKKSNGFSEKSNALQLEELHLILDKYFEENTYLFNNYSFSILEGTIENIASKNKIVEQVDNASNSTFRSKGEEYDYDYFSVLTKENGLVSPKTIKFTREQRQQSKVYTELMTKRAYMGLDNIEEYQYAIYHDGQNIMRNDPYYGEFLISEDVIPVAGEYEVQDGNGRSQISYRDHNNNVVLISKETEGWIMPISLFSYLFTLLIICTLILGFLNIIFKFIPQSLSFAIIRKPSLKNRIQLSVIALIVISFLIIGIVTVVFFGQSHEQYHENRLKRKTRSVIRDTEHELQTMARVDSTLMTPKDFLDNLRVIEISNIHRIDINLYSLGGELSKTSEEDFYKRGILSRKINPAAYMALSDMKQKDYVQENEHIGDFVYKAAYIPVKLKQAGRPTLKIGYLSLPYYSQLSSTRTDAVSFMGTLLNVYVFLLMIAGAIAILVANSITKPLTSIGQKLNAFRLGGRNEKIEYKAKDELGILINEYNKMVQNIRESAEMLAQSEREGAWREMAKQVAHEIKNPLTPMKLSIQYLNHAYNNGAEDLGSLMKRVSNTLIQQIDNLAQIATEFSNFAKMPRAENIQLEVNSLLESVYNLFNEVKEVQLEIDMPEKQLNVFADKNHLVSVFNNIIKNAIQAIPEEKTDGKVDIRLYEQDGKAIVKISDNGSGISDEMREKVFVPNFTTKSSGTGLGLAISKNIIESVQGAIYFETEVGEGTDFYVTLPIIPMETPQVATS